MERELNQLMFVLMMILYQYLQMAASELPEELANFLPRNLIPERYEVTIQNNIDDSVPNYSGNVRIKV